MSAHRLVGLCKGDSFQMLSLHLCFRAILSPSPEQSQHLTTDVPYLECLILGGRVGSILGVVESTSWGGSTVALGFETVILRLRLPGATAEWFADASQSRHYDSLAKRWGAVRGKT